ncbi:Hypothetical protein, putative [Bodo saltans]|uniref:Uncharacterized protein n=1 Tax=Bodo saltans TaxID=75058 RepID=A0A0S4IT61_BODSA|nr:Hypothetical protein, putative [Bodo saltans]|eukprot:CUG06390.1 Hypothetical protein, putative [Bodo saltans]
MMSLKELMHFEVGNGRRSLYSFHYTGDACTSSSALTPASVVPTTASVVDGLQRSPNFQLPEPLFTYQSNKSWSCDLHDDCGFSHSSSEAAYHFDNYKRHACSQQSHLHCYPLHVQLEMGIAAVERGVRSDTCEELHRCPFYHSYAERDAWEAWRRAYLGFCPSDRTSSIHGQQFLALHPMYVKMKDALEFIYARMSAEARRVDAGDVGALAVGPVDVLVLASEMGESCTHRVLCFMMFIEYAIPNVVLAWPVSNSSAALQIQPESLWSTSILAPLRERHASTCVMVDPLTSDVLRFMSADHLNAIGEWLLMAAQLIGADSVVPLKFFPHCTHEPFAHSVPHKYYAYLALVASALTTDIQRDAQTLRPLSFLLHVSAPIVQGLSHWVVGQGWIKRRAVDTNMVQNYLDRNRKATEVSPAIVLAE